MGNPPAVVIVARHGARLDAADDNWQSNSQTPYDSPLSYGGWTQTRALGARIASLLHARDAALADEEARSRRRQSDASLDGRSSSRGSFALRPKSKRKTRVVIHTSPFLRCVQSSIAISAGMAQYHGNLMRLEARPKTPESLRSHSRAQTLDSRTFEEKFHGKGVLGFSVPEPAHAEDSGSDFEKPILRIDACLGEWLSPDYYEFTTSPPPSNMMVGGAKAELMRSAEQLQGAKIVEPDGSVTEFPSGGAGRQPVHRERPRSSTISVEDLARVHGSGAISTIFEDTDGSDAAISDSSSSTKPRYVGYIPPTPTYALLHSAPIPTGYVSHARDACINIDLQWDSMRDPQFWGDGGTYGEEWSAMHRRFRSGVANMVEWYKHKGVNYDPQKDEKPTEDDHHVDDDTDTVLVIMTHGAGCNALIGALTNQPVLMDIGMGSLTMAMRKPRAISAQSPSNGRQTSPAASRRRRSSVIDHGLSEEYDMKLMASTEHLRAGPDPLVIPQLANPGQMPSIAETTRRGSVATSSGRSTPQEMDLGRSKNSSLGSMRRTSVKSISTRNFSPTPLITSPTSSGLWGTRTPTVDKFDEGEDGNAIGDDQQRRTSTTSGMSEASETQSRHDSVGEVPASATAGRSPGLWGASPTAESKRRYTVGARK